MLYFLYGNDIDKARAKALELVLIMQTKKPDAELFRLDKDNWSQTRLDELAGAQGLFERKFIVLSTRLLESKDIRGDITEKFDSLKSSDNIFIFLEESLDKATLALVEKFAEKIQTFEKTVTKKPELFNLFSLADALGERNKKQLWVLYERAIRHDSSPEELSGILFWQLKSLIVASKTASAAEAGLSPFVFSKAKRYAKNFSDEDLEKLSLDLLKIYHRAHRGEVDFETSLERFILAV